MTEQSTRALVVIDPQKEFLTPEGFFGPEAYLPGHQLYPMVEMLTRIGREQGDTIVWVRSEYSNQEVEPRRVPRGLVPEEIPMNGDFLAKAHCGKRKCCLPGSPMSEFTEEIQKMIAPSDLIITKDRYSVMMGSDLEKQLKERGITELVFLGLVTNVCVLASVTDSFFLGYRVTVVADGVLAGVLRHHQSALRKIEKYYGAVKFGDQLLMEWGVTKGTLWGLGEGDSYLCYHAPVVTDAEGVEKIVLEEIIPQIKLEFLEVRDHDGIKWQRMPHRGGEVPRLLCMQGTRTDGCEPIYRHPADEQPPMVDWTSGVDRHRQEMMEESKQDLNHALVQWYRSGGDFIGEHVDKTQDVLYGTEILNKSLGATRLMILKSKWKVHGKHLIIKIRLPHGSIFHLGWKTNQKWYHSIKMDKRPEVEKSWDERICEGQRISITARSIATFLDPERGLYGQGVGGLSRAEAVPVSHEREEEEKLLSGFSKESQELDFNWKASYGAGNRALNFKTLNAEAEKGEEGEEGEMDAPCEDEPEIPPGVELV